MKGRGQGHRSLAVLGWSPAPTVATAWAGILGTIWCGHSPLGRQGLSASERHRSELTDEGSQVPLLLVANGCKAVGGRGGDRPSHGPACETGLLRDQHGTTTEKT